MKIDTIDGHTFDNGLIKSGWVIDAGCRGWAFSKGVKKLTTKILALDIEDFADVPDGIHFKHAALTHYSGEVDAWYFGDGTGNFLRPLNDVPGNTQDRPCEMRTVAAVTLSDIYSDIGTDIDLLKLDIEGAEYSILRDIEPVPKQISVEFHEHTVEHLHKLYIDDVIRHVSKFYEIHLFNVIPRYHFLNCLFIRR